MERAFDFVGWIASWIAKFFPRWQTVDQNQGAVKYEGFFLPRWLRVCCGGFDGDLQVHSLGPGLHWYWPATTNFEVVATALQTDNLPSQTIETRDGQSVTIGAMISYRISDVGKLIPNCYAPMNLIATFAMPAIHKVACSMNWADLKESQRNQTLNTQLRNAVKKKLTAFGVDVESVELTDMTKVRAYRLIQSTQNDTSSTT